MPAVSVDEVLEVVRRANTRIDAARLGPDSDLREIGADSLDMMTILLDVQGLAGFEIPDGDVGELRTPNQISSYILRHQPAA